MEDPAEIAALCQEYVSSLDNVPHEVTHILKEIQHKDGKVQDLLPKIAAREGQLRDLLNKGSPGAPASAGGTAAGPASAQQLPGVGTSGSGGWTDQEKSKAESLLDKIKLDYRRVDEWSSHKEVLSVRLWRILCGHQERLEQTFDKVAPSVMNIAQSNVAISMRDAPPMTTSATQGSAILGAIAAAFGGANGVGSGSSGMPALSGSTLDSSSSSVKRKMGSNPSLAPSLSSPLGGAASALASRPANATPQQPRVRTGSSSERITPGAGTSSLSFNLDSPSRGPGSPLQTYGSGGSGGGIGRPRKSGLQKGARAGVTSGLANVFSADGGSGDRRHPDSGDLSGISLGADDISHTHGPSGSGIGGEGNGEDERDETLYCFCRKVSYGEMIGCDNDECKYEWFHLDCVGLSKPLPQVWYCSDCQARMRSTTEKEGSVELSEPKDEAKGGKAANKRRKKA